jgi:putative spermidine/putrescine transport system ATP-binding protein
MMIAGFETPTSGDILLNDRSITRLPAHKRNIGVVFQNYALFPHMTVEKNLAFPLEARGMSRVEISKRIAHILEMVQLAGYAQRRIGQLSGGQQQRVALARALIFDPVLVLMDEPLGALDRQLREAMQYEIKKIHGALGVSIVYVTHDQDEALTMSDRIAVLNKGRIEQIATPPDLYERPASAFVAGFVGENNCLNGRIKSIDGDICTIETPWGLVRAIAENAGPIATPTIWSVRPERTRINPAPGTVDNQFEALIKAVNYLGDHIRMQVMLGQQDDFILKIQNNQDVFGIAVGETATVGWLARDCRALRP